MICGASLLEEEEEKDMEKNHADSHLDKMMNSVKGRLYYGNSSLILVYNWFSFSLFLHFIQETEGTFLIPDTFYNE